MKPRFVVLRPRFAVDEPHEQYVQYVDQWSRARIACKGQDAVHAAKTRFLPRLTDQDDVAYSAYVLRANFYNASWRTLEGLRGMMFRIPPKVVVPKNVEEMMEDVDLKGTPFELQVLEIAEEALKCGRLGLFVDYPDNGGVEDITLADAETLNLRPVMHVYVAESIINWKTRVINNKTTLTQVRLAESAVIPSGSEFSEKTEKRWRVLDLDPAAQDYYRVRVFRKNERKEDELVSETYPMMNNKFMDFIPFYFLGVDSNSWECDDPPLIDLIDVNLSHYRVTADYEHGCHFTGLPTPWIAGHRAKQDENGNVIEKFYIGSTAAWVFNDKDTKVGYLEFNGTGLGSLEKNLERKEARMAVLGARMLEPQQKQVETAEAAAIHRGGENSLLSSMAQSLSLGVRPALICFSRWSGNYDLEDDTEDVVFELNREFLVALLKSDELTAYVGAWQKGAISYESLFAIFQRHEVVDRELTFEEERAKIDAEGPKLTAGMPGLPGSESLIPGGPAKPPAAGTKPVAKPPAEAPAK